MANWCENTLDIYGSESELKEFLSLITKEIPKTDDMPTDGFEIQLIETLIPRPENVEDWYQWSVKNWGARSPDCETSASQIFSYFNNTGKLQLRFMSAWSPTIPAVKIISQQFPDFTFMLFYQEQCMGFIGYYFVKAGSVLDEDEGKYIPTADESEMLFDYIQYSGDIDA